jgi:hypothetical protein
LGSSNLSARQFGIEVILMDNDIVGNLFGNVPLPRMTKVRQIFPKFKINDISAVVHREIDRPEISGEIKRGEKIAIAVGSRGIANIALITKEVVNAVRKLGADPFVIPAMGSHGGATAEGQLEILASLGITEAYLKAPIKASMAVAKIGDTPNGKPVYIDKFAAEADGIIVIGRIKPHTCFRGKYESGIMKMLTIGLGKQKGADFCHAEGFKRMAENVPLFANVILEKANILFGLALLENSYDQTCKILALTKKEIPEKEPVLLIEAKGLMPRIMFDSFDVLVVDRIGKNISGDGMDPNITGTYATPYATGGPDIQRVVVLDLTEETHGNANGIGMADFTTKRLFDKINFAITYPNALTARVPCTAKIPVIMKNDREAIAVAVKTCCEIAYDQVRIVRIKDSLHLDEIYISEALLAEARKNSRLEILGEAGSFEFNQDGNLF